MTPADVVLDASVFVQAVVDREGAADEWVRRLDRREVVGLAPDLVYAEVANALHVYARGGRLSAAAAQRALVEITRLPLQVQPLSLLARPALRFALSTGLSVYDGCYLAVARAAQALLVTADRRLAAAAQHSQLLTVD